jgi:hypothetical protein
MGNYMDAKQVREALMLDDQANAFTSLVEKMLDLAYLSGTSEALEEIREGRYISDGYYDQVAADKLAEEAWCRGYDAGIADEKARLCQRAADAAGGKLGVAK